MYEIAHTLVALDALEAGAPAAAARELRAALEWPESLGQGRPYAPEERLARFLLGIAEGALGNDDAARQQFEAVVSATDPARLDTAAPGRLDLLAIAASRALGSTPDTGPITRAPPTLFDDLD